MQTTSGCGSLREGTRRPGRLARRFRQITNEAPHVTEMLVALDVSRQIRPSQIDLEPTKRRLGEQEIRPFPLQTVLEQPMREDDVDAGHLAAATDQLSQEAPMVGDDLEIQICDVPARATRARIVRF